MQTPQTGTGRRGSGRLEATVPQFVMHDNPVAFHGRPEKIDADIKTFLGEHGFNGLHTCVFCRWFDINEERPSGVDSEDPKPDQRIDSDNGTKIGQPCGAALRRTGDCGWPRKAPVTGEHSPPRAKVRTTSVFAPSTHNS